ncbi:MAG: hypothetical protein QM687_11755 [Ferruginibacter sp.]
MTKKIIACLLMALPILGKAQVNVNVQMPPAGLVQKEQLWDLVLVNNSSDMLDITLQLNLQEASTGQVVLTGTTGNLLLGKGAKMIKAANLQPITYTYNLPDFARSFMPMGSYIVSYQVIDAGGRKDVPIAEERLRINIDPLSPPLLSSPADKSVIETPYPQFTWMPPTPFDMFTSLSYDLLVTEVLEGQSSTEAIQYNTPIYTGTNITHPYTSYSTGFSKLDTGKLYAWQVVAKNGLSYAVKTEVWTFRIARPSWVQQIIEQTPFIKMKMNSPEKGIAPNGFLKLSYINESSDTSLTVQVKELNKNNENGFAFDIKLTPGENLIQKDLEKEIRPKDGTLYEASIRNGRNEIWTILFEVKEYRNKRTERN